jgi:hypothetical protein
MDTSSKDIDSEVEIIPNPISSVVPEGRDLYVLGAEQ